MDHDSDGPASRIPLMADPAVADRYAWLAGLVAPSAGERVVDLGCGESSVLELVLAYLGHGIAVGIDNDRSALRAARSSVPASGPRALFVQADLADPLPLADASMDVVFSHDVLEQLPDPDLTIERQASDLASEVETVLYRIAQEALSNVRKHARADHAWVTMDGTEDGQVRLQVRDNGVGFDPGQASRLLAEGHFGLAGIRERVTFVGGRFDVRSAPGQGTTIEVAMPPQITDLVDLDV
jgi:signal transduction histidine kinase